MEKIDKLIISSPYKVPTQHWKYDRETLNFDLVEGRRPAGYIRATPDTKGFEDPGIFTPIELVNEIREQVDAWRDDGYPGITIVTKKLLEHWHDTEQREQKFFYCQLETIETLIWLVETTAGIACRQGLEGDGGPFERICSKLATGTGKTIVMAMIIAWNFLNKAANPQDERFSQHALVVAPGLTVKERLQVLDPERGDNYYEAFEIVPSQELERLRQGTIIIRNWHSLAWDTQEKLDQKKAKGQLRSVDKRKHIELSGEAYVKKALGAELANASNLLVINDEAHHAWRVNPDAKGKYKRVDIDKDSAEEATIWVGGLDRIDQQLKILRCFDLSATPFTTSGKGASETSLFDWIVSDFGLNDAIESGLVKTPTVATRDDSLPTEQLKSKLYHIYFDPKVKADLGRVGKQVEESEPLPDLVRDAYTLLGGDWQQVRDDWEQAKPGMPPPVMITVANNIKTSARVRYAFENNNIIADEQLCGEAGLLQIDSGVLKKVENADEQVSLADYDPQTMKPQALPQKAREEYLRRQVSTVGLQGEPGEKVCNVISVGMLSEGWDAKNVTHIMGLRAFTSQLLCEQVIGRGLRRTSYDVGEDGLFNPEYVTIFGVPFTFLPLEDTEGTSSPPKPSTRIEPLFTKLEYAIKWPNVARINYTYKPEITIDWDAVEPLRLDLTDTITEVDLEAIIAGKPHPEVKKRIGLDSITESTRLQTIIFQIAKNIHTKSNFEGWQHSSYEFIAQLIPIVEEFIRSEKLEIIGVSQDTLEGKLKIILMLHITTVINHLWSAIRDVTKEEPTIIFDHENPILSTGIMRPWHTTKLCEPVKKSHINHCVYDSRWEASEAYTLDRSKAVQAFAKNDHLGFAINYSFEGIIRRYYPDFLVKLADDNFLVLEVKGQSGPKEEAKQRAMEEWCHAVTLQGGFGRWRTATSYNPNDLADILTQHNT